MCERRGKFLGDVACWSRPWLVPMYGANPVGLVRTHRVEVEVPRVVVVQPECGVEFNAVLNVAKLGKRYPAGAAIGLVEADRPTGGLRVEVRPETCGPPYGRWEEVCANGYRPGMRPYNVKGGCGDGSRPERACVYTIDLTDVYEPRETPAWCFESTRHPQRADRVGDEACGRPGEWSSCRTTEANAVDDWRVTSPWCWEQTIPKPPKTGLRGRCGVFDPCGIGQPGVFHLPPNCTLERDRCLDFHPCR